MFEKLISARDELIEIQKKLEDEDNLTKRLSYAISKLEDCYTSLSQDIRERREEYTKASE